MKKLFVLIVALTVYSGTMAQSGFEIGLHTAQGINITSEKDYNEGKPKTSGYSVGIRTSYSLRPEVDVQLSLLYTRLNIGQASYGWCGTPPVPTVEVQAKNVEVQAAIRYKFRSEKKLMPFVSAGATQIMKTSQSNSQDPENIWLETGSQGLDLSTLRIGMLATAGVKYKLNEKFSVDVESGLKYIFYSDASDNHLLSPNLGLTLNYRLLH